MGSRRVSPACTVQQRFVAGLLVVASANCSLAAAKPNYAGQRDDNDLCQEKKKMMMMMMWRKGRHRHTSQEPCPGKGSWTNGVGAGGQAAQEKKCFWKSEYERGESLYRTSTIHCTTTKLVADNEATGLSSAPLLVRKCSAHQLATSISELCSLQCCSWDANFCSIGVFWVTTSRTRGLERSLLVL